MSTHVQTWNHNGFLSEIDSTENLALWSGHSCSGQIEDIDGGHCVHRLGPVVIEY